MSLFNGLGSESEGDKQMKAAAKLCQPSFLSFRLAADWDQATPLFERAALNFKVRLGGNQDLALALRTSCCEMLGLYGSDLGLKGRE